MNCWKFSRGLTQGFSMFFGPMAGENRRFEPLGGAVAVS
jgi:hypothetical protein